jgi:uncharacterized protein YsxB (DUF464 family)
MLEVTFYRDADDRLCGISARGHADFAEHGHDIVCAAVSAILQATRLGLEAHARTGVVSHQHAGMLDLHLDQAQRDRESVRAIVATAELAIARIGRRFPHNVRVRRSRRRDGRPRPRTGNKLGRLQGEITNG